PEDPAAQIRTRFPGVRVMHVGHKLTVPALRWKAVPLTRGSIVAAIEGRSVPSATWAADLLAAHEQWPDAPAIGGPVDVKDRATAIVHAMATPALPALLVLRAATFASQRRMTSRFAAALPWLVAFNTAWSIGEMAGYLFGRAPEAQIF